MALSLTKINMATYFENLIDELHVIYFLNIHVKLSVKWMLFTIQSINLFFMHNFISQKLKIYIFD